MASALPSGRSQRQARTPRRHPRRPPGFGLWVLVALSCLSAVGLMLNSGGILAWVLAGLFVTGIVWHYLRLSVQRKPLLHAMFSGSGLLPLLIWIFYILTVPIGRNDLGSIFAATCIGSILFALMGAPAGFLAAVLIEAVRSIWVGAEISWRKRQRSNRETKPMAIRQPDDETLPLEMPPSYFLPRRFGVRGMLVLVTLASILMALMRGLDVPAVVALSTLVFFGGVLCGQIFLFRGRKPLAASAWVGAFLFPCETMIAANLDHLSRTGSGLDFPLTSKTLLGCICMMPAGIILGALAGAVAGGAYAVADDLFRRIFRGSPRVDVQSSTADDLDLLLAWLRGPKLLQRWSAGQFTFPLDRRQLLQRFDEMSGVLPTRLAFKAVEIGTGNMIGYVELGRIDHSQRIAFVQLPLIAPDAIDRDLLAIVMLRKIAEKAFRELGFLQLYVCLHDRDDELDQCCLRAWERNYDFCVITTRDDSGRRYLGRLEAWR